MKTKLSEVPKNAEIAKAIAVVKNIFYPFKEIWFAFTAKRKIYLLRCCWPQILHTCMVESGNPVHIVKCSRITTSG